jgi:hypothetical protein
MPICHPVTVVTFVTDAGRAIPPPLGSLESPAPMRAIFVNDVASVRALNFFTHPRNYKDER